VSFAAGWGLRGALGGLRGMATIGLGFGVALACAAPPARAVPSFARQTGAPCTTCHTAFPQLTPFGREFKLTGYTLSTTRSLLPPVAVMLQGAPGYTRTRKSQAADDVPSGFTRNDNVSLNQISLFYAGRLFGPYADRLLPEQVASVLDKFGTFTQVTWDGVEHNWGWDNTEVRFADTTRVAGKNLIYGISVNNNPTMEDVYNTTPAWGFPFSGSSLAPSPTAAPLLAGGLSQQVIGFGAYTKIADLLYIEAGGYGTLGANLQRHLGVDPSGETELASFAPYWRIALEKDFGVSSLEIGTYGMQASTYPGRMHGAGSDDITDIGADLQYQYLSGRNDLTLLLNGINERARWSASQRLGLTDNQTDTLWTTTATASYLFDKTYGADVQYFLTNGDTDATLYGSRTGSPESRGFVFQLDWLPFNKRGGPAFWDKSNVKVSLQYILYQRFDGSANNYDGSGRDASDNDTLFLQLWWAF
jgi:hypothetical protein